MSTSAPGTVDNKWEWQLTCTHSGLRRIDILCVLLQAYVHRLYLEFEDGGNETSTNLARLYSVARLECRILKDAISLMNILEGDAFYNAHNFCLLLPYLMYSTLHTDRMY